MHNSGSGGFLENPRLWQFSSGSQQAKKMIKVPENGWKVLVEKLVQNHFVVAFQSLSKEGAENKVEQAFSNLVPKDFLEIRGFGDLVQGPSKPKL